MRRVLGSSVFLILVATPAVAVEFEVDTTTADTLDAVAGDGACRRLEGDCLLRTAITEAARTPA